MFQINVFKNKVQLTNQETKSLATIYLDLGGSLQELTLNNKEIIKDFDTLPYYKYYASAILFPFTNRIENGKYSFNNNEYNLELNENNVNAIHGLVYNKKFKIISQQYSNKSASITIAYHQINQSKGFPFNYKLHLNYTLSSNSLSLEATVFNNDLKAFPFTIGWHPYFYSRDLFNSFLDFSSSKKLVFNHKMIPSKIEEISLIDKKFKIKNKKFDDCYIINHKNLNFETPNYSININSSSDENYFQIYTPNTLNTIALEPMTGPANNFNNKLGLQILNPNETYSIDWKIQLNNSKIKH